MRRNNITFMKNITLGLVLLWAAFGLSACSGASPSSANSGNGANTAATPAAKPSVAAEKPKEIVEPEEKMVEPSRPVGTDSKSASAITKANYEKIREGMTLAEVEKILGDEGLKVGTNTINGRTTEIYKWTDDNFTSYIDVIFEKDNVVEKREKNLK